MARILVIDDDELIRDTLRRILQQAGHQVDMAEHGGIGLEALQRRPVDLVICDLFMPDMEGFETMRSIRERHADLKIIAMSGGARGLDRDAFLDDAEILHADATLPKPFKNSDLIGLVEELLASP